MLSKRQVTFNFPIFSAVVCLSYNKIRSIKLLTLQFVWLIMNEVRKLNFVAFGHSFFLGWESCENVQDAFTIFFFLHLLLFAETLLDLLVTNYINKESYYGFKIAELRCMLSN